ncbi:YegS/Rv2252/BmrU family lipid kinase [bacterium]|nr:YegS/Rv2252/BmrU family lipid kinase [bacterium]
MNPVQRNIFLLANPAAGNGKTAGFLPKVIAALEQQGINHQCFLTTHDQLADQLVARHFNESFNELWVVGGDGTFCEALNGFNHFDLPVALIQTGTGNDFSRALPGKQNPEAQLKTALLGGTKRIDLGKCNGRYFHNGVGIGFDGTVAQRAAELKAELSGSVRSYYRAIAEGLFGYKGFEYEMTINGKHMNGRAFMATIGNGTSFGGGMKVCPQARVDDQKLDVCLVQQLSVAGRLWRLPFLVAGQHSKLPKISYQKGTEIHILCSTQVAAHLDGEVFMADEFAISLCPGQLLLRWPA